MKAFVAHRTAEGLALRIADIGEPTRGRDDEALVAIEYAALEAGALDLRDRRLDGRVVGRGFAGRVLARAADGSGPDTGARVVGIDSRGAARERLAVRARALSIVPDSLDLDEAVMLPVPGLGAYHALARAGFAFGKRLTVLGAASATGQFACQIGLGSGMRLAALVERTGQRRAVTSHGVEDVRVWAEGGANSTGVGLPATPDAPQAVDLIVDASAGRCPSHPTIALALGGTHVAVSVDELGAVRESAALAGLKATASPSPFVAIGAPDAAEVDAVVLARLLHALSIGDIVLPLPAESVPEGARGPTEARCLSMVT